MLPDEWDHPCVARMLVSGSPTGIDPDYFNEFRDLYAFWETTTPEIRMDSIRARPPRRYYERFPGYQRNPSMAETVQRLDQICDEISALSSRYSDEDLKRLVVEAHDLIYGSPGFLSAD